MADIPKVVRLSCPVCETRLKIANDIARFACLNCGTELSVVQSGNILRLEPTPEASGEMSSSEQELVSVQAEIKQRDDTYGAGCALSTLSVMFVGCIGGLLAIFLKSTLALGIIVGIVVVLLAVILFFFVGMTTQGTREIERRRKTLAAQVAQEQAARTAAEQGPGVDFENGAASGV